MVFIPLGEIKSKKMGKLQKWESKSTLQILCKPAAGTKKVSFLVFFRRWSFVFLLWHGKSHSNRTNEGKRLLSLGDGEQVEKGQARMGLVPSSCLF